MKKLFLAKEYLLYLLKAKNLHGVHSPFVYAFNKDVVNDTRFFYAFEKIQNWRNTLLHNKTTIDVTDFGAGSLHTTSNTRRICDIAKLAGKQHKHGALLYRMVDAYASKNILELGTSMGIGTAYLASANTNAIVTTLEGCSNIAAQAKLNFEYLQLKNVRQVVGNFDETLPQVLLQQNFDFVFIDGNHRYEPTINYFKQIIEHTSDKLFIVFDDIHWSAEMLKAWNEIVADKRVLLTIDVFQFGICVIDNSFKEKQHFVISY